LLEDRIAAVPKRERYTEKLAAVGEAGEAVLAPTIGAAAGLIMGQIIPCRPTWAVILAHRPPLPLAEIGAPQPPILLAVAPLFHALLLGVDGLWHGELVGSARYCFSVACVSKRHASSVQATDHACAGAPRGWCGGSPSKISPIVPTPWSSSASLIRSSKVSAASASPVTR